MMQVMRIRFWNAGEEHSQFSNSSRVSFCLASVERRDCRLLIVALDGDGDSETVSLLYNRLKAANASPKSGHCCHVGDVRFALSALGTSRPGHNEAPRICLSWQFLGRHGSA